MKIYQKFSHYRNTVDFYLRNSFKWGRKVTLSTPLPETDKKLQAEFKEFFTLFNWAQILSPFLPKSKETPPIVVADIGARNFAFGPVIDSTFEKAGIMAEIHGIEIDAFRLLSGFHSRKNYGDFYANQMREGTYHPIDFLNWNEPLHLALLLNPFVSEEPTLSWGLPLSTLHPKKIFQHTFNCLDPQKGRLLLTCPSIEELEIAKEISKSVGFKPLLEKAWFPKPPSVQQKPRYGILYETGLSS